MLDVDAREAMTIVSQSSATAVNVLAVRCEDLALKIDPGAAPGIRSQKHEFEIVELEEDVLRLVRPLTGVWRTS